MEVIKIDSVNEMLKYKDDWIALRSKDLESTFYQSFEYNYIWAKHHLDSNNKLNIYVVVNNNQIVSIAPFYITSRNKSLIKWNELRFLGMGDYRSILIDDSQVNRSTLYNLIINTIIDLQTVDRILLSNIPNNNSLLNYLLSSELYNKNTKYLIENPIVNVRAKDQITPSKANKKRNKVKREINYQFSVETEISDDLYNEFTDLHKRQQAWMQDEMDRTERRSHYNDSKLEAFIKEVSLLKKRSTIFLIRNAEDELIFYRYCYLDKDTLYSWNSAYDYKYHDYNLSDIAILEMLKYIEASQDIDHLDLGAGGYPWKFRWTNKANILYNFDYWLNKKSLAYKLFKLRGK